jgi:hypothetical protein
VGLANLGSVSETCVGSLVQLVGVSISFEKNFYRLPLTPPSLVRRIGPSVGREKSKAAAKASGATSCGSGENAGVVDLSSEEPNMNSARNCV